MWAWSGFWPILKFRGPNLMTRGGESDDDSDAVDDRSGTRWPRMPPTPVDGSCTCSGRDRLFHHACTSTAYGVVRFPAASCEPWQLLLVHPGTEAPRAGGWLVDSGQRTCITVFCFHYYTTDLSSIAQNIFSLGNFGDWY
jgi:hypothetical protein